MEIMVYPIEETTEATHIFELINNRGKRLTDLEKTKSYLMYMVSLTAPESEELELGINRTRMKVITLNLIIFKSTS